MYLSYTSNLNAFCKKKKKKKIKVIFSPILKVPITNPIFVSKLDMSAELK